MNVPPPFKMKVRPTPLLRLLGTRNNRVTSGHYFRSMYHPLVRVPFIGRRACLMDYRNICRRRHAERVHGIMSMEWQLRNFDLYLDHRDERCPTCNRPCND